jgi:hypothetical protein
MKKTDKRNLQPWLDYFGMLQEYEQKGFLQTEPGKNEAYVTQAALHTLAGADDGPEGLPAGTHLLRRYADVLRRIRVYTGWRGQQGAAFLTASFALHVVKDEHPHDLLCTVLLTRRRRWWALWRKVDCYDVIAYDEKKREK